MQVFSLGMLPIQAKLSWQRHCHDGQSNGRRIKTEKVRPQETGVLCPLVALRSYFDPNQEFFP